MLPLEIFTKMSAVSDMFLREVIISAVMPSLAHPMNEQALCPLLNTPFLCVCQFLS